MNDALRKKNEELPVDADIARMQEDFKKGRFTLDFEGMDKTTVLQRAEHLRQGLYGEHARRPENQDRPIGEVHAEADRTDFFPHAQTLCEKLTEAAEDRFERAFRAYAVSLEGSTVRPGRKAASIRRAIDAKSDAALRARLSEEKAKLDAQKKAMEKYLRLAPHSVYARMIAEVLSKNEEGYRLTERYLTAQATVAKYDTYEKSGALAEEEKKLCTPAKEVEQAAHLCLCNHKQSTYLLQERDATLRLSDKELARHARERLRDSAKSPLAFVEIPQGLCDRLLEHALTGKEETYYRLLQKKAALTGFHPFQRLSLRRELQKTAKAYSLCRTLLAPDQRELHPPLSTLEDWKARVTEPVKRAEDSPVKEAEQAPKTHTPKQIDLAEQLHTRHTVAPQAEKEADRSLPEIEKEL